MKYKAIIWDCDGVLIDSEVLACGAAKDMLNDLGCNISLPEYIARFAGKTFSQAVSELERENGLKLADKISTQDLEKRQAEIFSRELKAVSGVKEALQNINLPMAVASGSSYKRLQHSLSITGLWEYFDGHVYSAEMVAKGKPAPDIFLYAAKKLGTAAGNCLVIEDGIHGINGAKAAGMDVFAYVGGSHITDDLKNQVVNAEVDAVLSCMSELLPLLKTPVKKAG